MLLASPNNLIASDEHLHAVADMSNLECKASALVLTMMMMVARGRIGAFLTVARGNTNIHILVMIKNSNERCGS